MHGSQFFSKTIPGYLQGFSRSKKPFSRLLQTIFAQKEDVKGVLNSQEYKSWKQLSQYNIEMFYILTFQVLSRFSAIFFGFVQVF